MKWVWVIGVCGAMWCGAAAAATLPAARTVDASAEDERAARALIAEDLPTRQAIRLFWEIERHPDGGWGVAMALLVPFWEEDSDAALGGRPGKTTRERERARWAVWCLVGPERYHALMRVGPGLDEAALEKCRRGDPRSVETDPRSIAFLLRSSDAGLFRDGVRLLLAELDRGEENGKFPWYAFWDRLASIWDADPSPAPRRTIVRSIKRELGRPVRGREHTVERRIELLPVLLRAMADEDAEMAKEARPLVEGLLNDRTAIVLVDAAVEYPRLRTLVWGEMGRFTDKGRKAALQRAQWWIAMKGKEAGVWTVIEKFECQNAPATRYALEVARLEPGERSRYAGVIGDSAGARDGLVSTLSDRDPIRRAIGARLLVAGAGHFDAAEVLSAALQRAGEGHREAVVASLTTEPVWALLMAQAREGNAKLRAPSAAIARAIARDDAAFRKRIEPLLKGKEESLRQWAAMVLATPEAWQAASVPELLRDLKSEQPEARMSAARRVETMELVPPRVAAALVRATDGRNMAVRQGIVMAIEKALASSRSVEEVLKELADAQDPATRAYARAALREIAEK